MVNIRSHCFSNISHVLSTDLDPPGEIVEVWIACRLGVDGDDVGNVPSVIKYSHLYTKQQFF
jgi:hypothetical protein